MTTQASELFARWVAEPDVRRIGWQDIGADGTRYALLHGRRDLAGEAFIYAFWLPGGFWDAPHFHSADARVAVIQGELRLGYGPAFDPPAALPHRAGSELLVPAGAVHFDGSQVDTLILGLAVGPWITTYLDPNQRGSAGTPD